MIATYQLQFQYFNKLQKLDLQILSFFGKISVGEGFSSFHNGIKNRITLKITNCSNADGDGRAVIGRQSTNADRDYCSVEMDDLLFWNKALAEEDIEDLFLRY